MLRFRKTWFLILILLPFVVNAQSILSIDPTTKNQTVEGFGGSLAYYENWLTEHPNKEQVYTALFEELSLDILRVRNAHGYDETMIYRVAEFMQSAESIRGNPIKLLSTSWGPPAAFKSNNDRSNGGTLRYEIVDGNVRFDYEAFANWWEISLDTYEDSGVLPDYISIQNEPDYLATWESCLLNPSETITSSDTIAGYDKALAAIRSMISAREVSPKIIGPETIGIGYNTVQNYMSALNIDHLEGLAHHLYHGVDEFSPWESNNFSLIGNLYPDLPIYQSEYSRGDWFSLGGLMYKSFHDEQAVAYLYWDLIWDGAGLVNLEFPWDENRWTTEEGFIKTKTFYAFKQYSAFVHPEWKRIECTQFQDVKNLAFLSPSGDSVAVVMVNRSETEYIDIDLRFSEHVIKSGTVYRTTETENCAEIGSYHNLRLPPKSISTATLIIEDGKPTNTFPVSQKMHIYPNPASNFVYFNLPDGHYELTIFDSTGKVVLQKDFELNTVYQSPSQVSVENLYQGTYYYQLKSTTGMLHQGLFLKFSD